MRRPATEILRRGFENALANWPLILIRVAEGIVMIGIVIAAIVAAIVPLAVSIGLSHTTVDNPADAAEAILDIFAAHWLVLLYIFFIVSFVLLLMIVIHSFVAAGCALVYVDAERRVAALAVPTRNDFRAFSGERWMTGGKDGWWPVFWIYNVAWGVGGLIMMAPLVVVIVAMLALRGVGTGAAIAAGCFGAVVSGMFMILVAIVTNIWTEKAIVDCMARSRGVMESLHSAWREIRTDTGRHVAVAIVAMAVMFAGSMLFSSFSWIGSFNHNAGLSFALLPLQFSSSIANTLFSTAVGAWLVASFAALAVER